MCMFVLFKDHSETDSWPNKMKSEGLSIRG